VTCERLAGDDRANEVEGCVSSTTTRDIGKSNGWNLWRDEVIEMSMLTYLPHLTPCVVDMSTYKHRNEETLFSQFLPLSSDNSVFTPAHVGGSHAIVGQS
jgi:hypothetical protein